MAKKDWKHVVRPTEVKWDKLPDMPHHRGGWSVRDLVRKGNLTEIPLHLFPVDVIEMSIPVGGHQEPGKHKDRWHVNVIKSGKAVFTIDGKSYPVRKGSVIMIPSNIVHSLRNTGNVPLVQFAVHVSPAKTNRERRLGTDAWKPPKK